MGTNEEQNGPGYSLDDLMLLYIISLSLSVYMYSIMYSYIYLSNSHTQSIRTY